MIEALAVNGTTLSVMSLGQGAPTVMLHGLVFGSLATWYSAYALPLAQTRRVVLYDLRGHGDSAATASGYDLATQTADLEGVLAASCAPDEPVTLVGHSVGALIALRFAVQHPERVRRLVLVDAPSPASHYVAPSLAGVTDAQALDAYLDSHGRSGRAREKLRLRLRRLFFESSLVADVRAMHAEPDADLARLCMPVTLIYGARSPCRAAGTALAAALPDTRLIELDGGHYLPEEAPVALLRALHASLDSEVPHAAL